MMQEKDLNKLLSLFKEDDEMIKLLLNENDNEKVLTRKLIHKQLTDNLKEEEKSVKIFDEI